MNAVTIPLRAGNGAGCVPPALPRRSFSAGLADRLSEAQALLPAARKGRDCKGAFVFL